MNSPMPLSRLAALIQESVDSLFGQQVFWVMGETADVKKYPQKRWCFLKLLEKKGNDIVCDMQANIWANAYNSLLHFEKSTTREFGSGIQIACQVKVIFHPKFGLRLEVVQIDAAYTRGWHDLQRQQTLEKLLRDYPHAIRIVDDEVVTFNRQLAAGKVWQRIALIAAPNSDGHRDFMRELEGNAQGFFFHVHHFPVQVQGAIAARQIAELLTDIRPMADSFDVVAIVRGGGSDTDLSAFDDFEVAKQIALFPVPVLTGIGHDRNITISDMMGWSQKTPTKAAAVIIEKAFHFTTLLMQAHEDITTLFEQKISRARNGLMLAKKTIHWLVPGRISAKQEQLIHLNKMLTVQATRKLKLLQHDLAASNQRLERCATGRIRNAHDKLRQVTLLVAEISPDKILSRGFAMVMQEGRVIVDAGNLDLSQPMVTLLKNKAINSEIKSIES